MKSIEAGPPVGLPGGLRIGFVTGSSSRIGSGQAMVQPLALALRRQGCFTCGLELSRWSRGQSQVGDLLLAYEPRFPYLLQRPLPAFRALWARRRTKGAHPLAENALDGYDQALGQATLALADRLRLDLLYAFHNTCVARLLAGWPHPSRILAINLVGFGIDPSRGGAVDTFPLQRLVFERPYWDLHITATRFELGQYQQVYRQLGLDPLRLLYLPHSYADDLFRPLPAGEHPAPLPAALGHLGPESKLLFYPVNVYPRKNIEMAIEVLSLLARQADVHLLVPGAIWDRDYHARLLVQARRLGVSERVHFLGGISHELLIACYQRADATLFTSHQETYGIGIVESLGCGTPVIGPDWIIPCREILGQAPGGWLAPKEVEAFARTVLQALQTDRDPQQIAEAARLHYGSSMVAARFLEALQPVFARKGQLAQALQAMDWKALYCDAGKLL